MTQPTFDVKSLLRSRRKFLLNSVTGLGGMALLSLLGDESARAAQQQTPPAAATGPLAPKKAHLPAKAKSCIFLLMDGGASHIDTFDAKPKLKDLHMTEFVRERSKFVSQMESGKRYYVTSPFNFIRAKNGMEVCEHFSNVAECVSDICFYRGGQAESVNHPTALYQLNTGSQFGTEPAIGSWVS